MEFSKYIPDGLKVTLISAGTYLGCYEYHSAYAAYFHIPSELISVSLSSLLVFASAAVVAVLFGMQIIVALLQLARDGAFGDIGSPFSIFAKKWGALSVMAALLFLISGYELNRLWHYWYFIVWPSADLLIPMVGRKEGVSYGERLKNWITFCAKDDEPKPESGRLWDSHEVRDGLFVFMVVAVFVAFCVGLGHGSARRRDTFAFVGSEALVASYGNVGVLCRYDGHSNKLTHEFRTINLSTDSAQYVVRKVPNVVVNDIWPP